MAHNPVYRLPTKREWSSFTISTAANGQSDDIDLGGATMSALAIPATWTAASLTFLASPDRGTTFFDVYGSTGDEITYTVAASRVVTFDPAFWLGIRHLRVRSGTTATPVPQAAERTLYIGTQALGVIR